MLMNYHEMTMDEARDSPARRKQFLFICTVMAAVFAHSMLTSGALSKVDIKEGVFPGGTFVYKYTARDYAASGGLMRSIGKDLDMRPKDFADVMYTLYLDDPNDMGGRRQRFASGILVDKSGKDMKKKLLDMNPDIMKRRKGKDMEDLPAFDLWKVLNYESVSLPSVDSAVLQFPFTNGFVSALIHSYKVLPALRKYAKEGGNKTPVVLMTCSTKEQMCTHYAPLVKGKSFLLGKPDTEKWQASLPKEELIDWGSIMKRLGRVIPPIKYLGFA